MRVCSCTHWEVREVKLAYTGGGSMLIPSIINGISHTFLQSPPSFKVELALYDADVGKVQSMPHMRALWLRLSR